MAVPAIRLIQFGVVMICLGEILHIVGVATTGWIVAKGAEEGLFRLCIGGRCTTFGEISKELKAVQAMVILGGLSGLAGAVTAIFVVVHMFMARPVSKVIFLLCQMVCTAALVFILIGIIVYVKKIYDPIIDNAGPGTDVHLGYSFALCIVGGALMFLGGILVFAGGKSTASGEYSPLIGN